jgi:hypothetical protein
MAQDKIYQLTAIGRPLDPAWPTNRAVLYLLPVLALLGGAMAWADSAGGSGIVMAALRSALLGFAAWAVARELAPDDQLGAFLAMAVTLTTLLNVPEPGFMLLFLAMFLARVLNRSTGVDLKKTDAVAVLLLAGLTAWSHLSPWPLAVTALAFGWSAVLPGGRRWQLWAGALALLAAGVSWVMFGPGIGSGAMLSRHGMVLPAIFGAGFLLAILATRQVAAVGDCDQLPLSEKRVRAGMWVVLLLAAANLAHGSPLAAEGVALWAVLGGVALGRLLQALRGVWAKARQH